MFGTAVFLLFIVFAGAIPGFYFFVKAALNSTSRLVADLMGEGASSETTLRAFEGVERWASRKFRGMPCFRREGEGSPSPPPPPNGGGEGDNSPPSPPGKESYAPHLPGDGEGKEDGKGGEGSGRVRNALIFPGMGPVETSTAGTATGGTGDEGRMAAPAGGFDNEEVPGAELGPSGPAPAPPPAGEEKEGEEETAPQGTVHLFSPRGSEEVEAVSAPQRATPSPPRTGEAPVASPAPRPVPFGRGTGRPVQAAPGERVPAAPAHRSILPGGAAPWEAASPPPAETMQFPRKSAPLPPRTGGTAAAPPGGGQAASAGRPPAYKENKENGMAPRKRQPPPAASPPPPPERHL